MSDNFIRIKDGFLEILKYDSEGNLIVEEKFTKEQLQGKVEFVDLDEK